MPKIDSIDVFYLAMPQIEDIGDGSQDTLLVRARAGGYTGWGECEASPLTSIASLVCPMSHSACKPVSASILGEELESPTDIKRIHQNVRMNSMDLLQADHTLSGIDVALWDLLGKILDEPVYRLLGFERAYPRLPYASVLFGDTDQETYHKAQKIRQDGYQALKFGWGPFGKENLAVDGEQVRAAREGAGDDAILCIDAGTVWGTDLATAASRIDVLEKCRVTWLEEPFHTGAYRQYNELASLLRTVRLAGGEGAHNEFLAEQMIYYAGVGYIQVDAGRIGGLTSAKRVADYAAARGVQYVNHTFTSHLALCASLQPYAGFEGSILYEGPTLCEYPVELKPLAYELTEDHLVPKEDGLIHLPDRPGLGIEPDLEAIKKYCVEVEIKVGSEILYRTPQI